MDKSLNQVRSFFDRCFLTIDFTASERDALAGAVMSLPFKAKSVVLWEGAREARMYFVVEGKVVVSKKIRGKIEEVITRFGPGDFFGEISLLDDKPRSATVQTEADSLLLVLEASKLLELERNAPGTTSKFYKAVLTEMVKRLRQTNEKLLAAVVWGMEATSLGEKEITE